MMNAVVVKKEDQVAVVIEEIKKGEKINYKSPDNGIFAIIAQEDIPIYHKVAINDISKNNPIIKYGEHIGRASEDIKIGNHVHEHNVKEEREDLHEKQ